MSSTSTEVGIATEHVLFTYVQGRSGCFSTMNVSLSSFSTLVVVATVALYDHGTVFSTHILAWDLPFHAALTLGREASIFCIAMCFYIS